MVKTTAMPEKASISDKKQIQETLKPSKREW